MSTFVIVIIASIFVISLHFTLLARTRRRLRDQFENELSALQESAAQKAAMQVSPHPEQQKSSGNGRSGIAATGGTRDQELSAETIAAIEASIAAITGKGVHIRASRGAGEAGPASTRWAGQGRITVQNSHEIVPSATHAVLKSRPAAAGKAA